MGHPTVTNDAMRTYLRERKAGLSPVLPEPPDRALAASTVWATFLSATKRVLVEHYVNDVAVITLHGEKKDALEIKASKDWYEVFKGLNSAVTGDLGFWRWITAYTPGFFDFARWRDGSLDSWPKKEAAFGIMRVLGDAPECVALRMYRRGLIGERGVDLGLWESLEEVPGTDLWRSGVLRRSIGNSPEAAALYVRAVVDVARESEVSITNLARAASKRVFRLRPLFHFEAMTPDEMRTLIEGQVKTAALELRK